MCLNYGFDKRNSNASLHRVPNYYVNYFFVVVLIVSNWTRKTSPMLKCHLSCLNVFHWNSFWFQQIKPFFKIILEKKYCSEYRKRHITYYKYLQKCERWTYFCDSPFMSYSSKVSFHLEMCLCLKGLFYLFIF